MAPPNITVQVSRGNLTMSWTADRTGWVLQSQINTLMGPNWVNLTGSEAQTNGLRRSIPSTCRYSFAHFALKTAVI